jgi:hypothetical protein
MGLQWCVEKKLTAPADNLKVTNRESGTVEAIGEEGQTQVVVKVRLLAQDDGS